MPTTRGTPERRHKTIRQILGDSHRSLEELIGYAPEREREGFRNELCVLLVFLHHRKVPLESGRSLLLAPRDEPLEQRRKTIAAARKRLARLQASLQAISGNEIRAALALADARELIAECEASVNNSGARKHPDYERRVSRMIALVREKTGKYHDRLVAEIVGAAADKHYPKMPDENAIRVWRFERGLRNPARRR